MKIAQLILTSKLGGWRTDLLWRAYGWVFFTTLLSRLHRHPISYFLQEAPFELPLLGFLGILLMCFGSRFALMLLSSACTWGVLWTAVSLEGSGRFSTHFPAAEYVMFTLPTTVSCILISFILFSDRKQIQGVGKITSDTNTEIDLALMYLFRYSLIIGTAFTGFHKINSDFLNTDVSCATRLIPYASKNWNTPLTDLLEIGQPALIILLELLIVPGLLFLTPRLGILVLASFFFGISLVGAPSVTGVMTAAGLAFLAQHQQATLARDFKRFLPYISLFIICALIYSQNVFRGTRHWSTWGQYQTVTFLVIITALLSLKNEWLASKGRGLSKRLTTFFSLEVYRDAPSRVWSRRIVHISMLILVLNCMAPYFGSKIQYSMAMLSNLRADSNRWNSYVVPEWFHFMEDQHILVSKVERLERNMNGNEPPAPQLNRALKKLKRLKEDHVIRGIYGPTHLRSTFEREKRLKLPIRVNVKLTYKGEDFEFDDIFFNQAFSNFIAQLPKKALFRKRLAIDRPQPCIH